MMGEPSPAQLGMFDQVRAEHNPAIDATIAQVREELAAGADPTKTWLRLAFEIVDRFGLSDDDHYLIAWYMAQLLMRLVQHDCSERM